MKKYRYKRHVFLLLTILMLIYVAIKSYNNTIKPFKMEDLPLIVNTKCKIVVFEDTKQDHKMAKYQEKTLYSSFNNIKQPENVKPDNSKKEDITSNLQQDTHISDEILKVLEEKQKYYAKDKAMIPKIEKADDQKLLKADTEKKRKKPKVKSVFDFVDGN